MAKLEDILKNGGAGNGAQGGSNSNSGSAGNGAQGGSNSNSGGAGANSGVRPGTGDRGVVEVETGSGKTQHSSQGPQPPTSDPSVNARRMVEGLREQQKNVVAPTAPQRVSVQDILGSGPSMAQAQGSQPSTSDASTSANPSTEPSPSKPKPRHEAAKVEKPRLSYSELIEKMYDAPTREELERERKRARRSAVFSAIGDGVSALANLYYTNHYAPSAYNPEQSLSKKSLERYEKLRKEREANNLKYVNAYINAAKADDYRAIRQQTADANEAYKKSQAEKNNAIAKAQEEIASARSRKDSAAAALSEKKLEYLQAGWPVELATKQAKLDYEKARADKARVDADNAPTVYDDKHEVAKATVDQKRASAANSYSRASGGSSGSGKGKKPYGRFLGVDYSSKADYDRAVVAYARRNGIPLTYMRQGGVAGVSATQTNRTIAGLAAAGEDHYRRTHQRREQPSPTPRPKPKAQSKPKVESKPKAQNRPKVSEKKHTGVSWK